MSDSSAAANTIRASFRHSFAGAGADAFTLAVDVSLPGSGITAVFGPSGSGKTTLLRYVAGLERPGHGVLSVNGESWQNLPAHKRPLGYVFQEASLFPHLTAQGNLAYAIKRLRLPLAEADYQHVIDTMAITPLLTRYPQQLSGGERQRVAIARALLIQPRLLLMDEPLAALDVARKQEILPYLERLRSEFDIPVLYVSHSLDEVSRLADYTVVLSEGKIVAQGSLAEVFSRIDLPLPLGSETGVVLEGRVVARDVQWHLSQVAFQGGELWVRDGGDVLGGTVRVRVLARDVSLALSSHADSSILNRLPVEVTDIGEDSDAAMALVRVKVNGVFLIARITRRSVAHLQLAVGKTAWAQIKSAAIVR